MKTGLTIFVGNMKKVRRFYAEVLGLERIRCEDSFSVLTKGNFELSLYLNYNAVHGITNDLKTFPKYSNDITPVFYASKTFEQASRVVEECGGRLPKEDTYSMDDGIHCHGYDCEGNYIKLVLRKSKS